MKNSILLLLISLSVSAQTKYRVYEKTGTVEFSTKAKAVAYCSGCDSIVTVNYSLVNEDSLIGAKKNFYLNQIKQTAQSAVNVKYSDLSITQIRALYAIDLFYKGAFDSTLKVRPLKEWVKN